MDSAIPLFAASQDLLKRWPWLREIRLFLIHYALWMALSLMVGWLVYNFLPADRVKDFGALMEKFQNDWSGYIQMSLVFNLVYLLPVHFSYWLYRRFAQPGKLWGITIFALYFVLYFMLLAVISGFTHGYLNVPFRQTEAVSSVVFMWGYTLFFIVIRAFRQYRRNQRELEKRQMQAELDALKAQINPHFLFNTLNNLYGTALTGDTERTAAGIEQLSVVMRHVTEASKLDFIPVEKELRFVEDIVELHRMRLPDRESIQIESCVFWDEQPAQILPLLLNPLIENAFKYGISLQHPSFVRISIRIENGDLKATIENSVHAGSGLEKGTGTGLKNVRQRMTLAYPKRHTLNVSESGGVFGVRLHIHLSPGIV